MKNIVCASFVVVLAQGAGAALPGDSAAGKRVHDASCTGCHDTSVYSRKDRTVRSFDALKEQMESCTHMAAKDFSAADRQNLIKYLNDQFYHFR